MLSLSHSVEVLCMYLYIVHAHNIPEGVELLNMKVDEGENLVTLVPTYA